MMRDYPALAQLSTYYFEDSYVVDIEKTRSDLIFYMDLVLTPQHERYAPPIPEEQYCYRHGRLIFHNISGLKLTLKMDKPAYDATGEEDYGYIDTFQFDDEYCYSLSGDWGDADFQTEVVQVILDRARVDRRKVEGAH